ncbi:unnamed protein product [Amoebophrya sp. A25]|nr:unnamed protein product [Amoebophrya sp. A25]|eukprot:GSA25T00001991001.1
MLGLEETYDRGTKATAASAASPPESPTGGASPREASSTSPRKEESGNGGASPRDGTKVAGAVGSSPKQTRRPTTMEQNPVPGAGTTTAGGSSPSNSPRPRAARPSAASNGSNGNTGTNGNHDATATTSAKTGAESAAIDKNQHEEKIAQQHDHIDFPEDSKMLSSVPEQSEVLDEADSVWSDDMGPYSHEYYHSEDFLNRPTKWLRYKRETYLDQVHRGIEIMEQFFIYRTVPADRIYKYDFSQVSDEHPQDILDAFLQMPGRKLIYYVGHTSLDGGWFFTWRNSVGMPDNWILRPADFEFGPPDRGGTPFLIVDGSYTKCWMEPSCKFITLACIDGPADGGGRRGPLLTRSLTGIDVQEQLRPTAELPPQEKKTDIFALDFSTETDGSLEMTPDPGHGRYAMAFWQKYNTKYGGAFKESDTYLPAPAGSKIRMDDNYEDSVVVRLPLYIVLYNKPTMDAVWSLRAVLEVATFTELQKVRVFGILPLILLIIAGQGEQVSRTDVNAFGGIGTVKAGVGVTLSSSANAEAQDTAQCMIDALEGAGMTEDAMMALEKSKAVVASGQASKLGKKRMQLEKEESERQSFAAGDKTWMFKTEQDNNYKKQKETEKLAKIAEEEEEEERRQQEAIAGAIEDQAKAMSRGGITPMRKKTGGKGVRGAALSESAENAMMRKEAVLVLGLIAKVLRLDEIERMALPVLTAYTSESNNFSGWITLAKLGEAYVTQTKGQQAMRIRTKISAKTWQDKLDEYYEAKTEALAKCGPALVAVPAQQLIRDCDKSLRALVRLSAPLPRWCRMESLEEAQQGCRLLAEGSLVNPKLCFRTCMRFPFDPEVLRWGLRALARGGFELLDKEHAYIPVLNGFTLKGNGLDETFASASLCFEKFLANDLWNFNIWDTIAMFLTLICERGCATQVCKGLLAACISLHRRFLRDGEAPVHFTWRPLTCAVLAGGSKAMIKDQKALDTIITAMATIVEYERKRGHHTNGNSLAIDLVNHWDQFLARAEVQELIPAYRYLVRMLKQTFNQPEELREIARKKKEAQQLFLDDESNKKGKKGNKQKKKKNQAGSPDGADDD